jgi:nucleoside-diphosphate-sugar epimerase
MLGGEEIVAAIQENFRGSKIELMKGDNPMPYPESRIASDFSRSKEQLGYQPDYPINKAVADYAATLRQLEDPVAK